MNQDMPAILGGNPVRSQPFVVAPLIDINEENAVLEAVRGGHFSRYIGSDSPDIETILRMPSKDAAEIKGVNWHYLGGPNVRQFAADFAAKFGVKYAIPVNSCTSGLSTALAAAGVSAGDEVIVPGMSFSATGTAVLVFNSIPVFVDVDPKTFCLDPEQVKKSITAKTKAILPVHLLGNACAMDQLMNLAAQYNLKVIEDCAQAIGTKYKGRFVGTIGDAGVFSFQQSKNIMTGEGGMIITNDAEIARRCRLIGNHGEVVMKDSHSVAELQNIIGFNFRMPELCAAVGVAQLKKMDTVNRWRNDNADYLIKNIGDIPGFSRPVVSPDVEMVYHLLAFLFDKEIVGMSRDLFLTALKHEGIQAGTGYVRSMYENPMFLKKTAYGVHGSPWTDGHHPDQISYRKDQCPVISSLLYEKFLWFYQISYPSTREDMQDIVTAVKKIIAWKDDIVNQFESGTAMKKESVRSQGRI
ncbi:MAG: DegT/DnrJ/EryC1/StrS family aminotransferase [Deltaproteobacteria bacterium]|nr:DegT/DnrJ/EryC1/StrS family aminotransferase [Deltaproteobacteria bacterium]